MRFYLDNFNRYKHLGLAAYKAGKTSEARYNLLKAAECLYKLAEKSEGKIRQERLSSAQRIVAMAKGLKVPAPTTRLEREQAGSDDSEERDFRIAEKPREKFSDVAGFDDVKEQIKLKMIYPLDHPDKAKKFGIQKGGGLLLYGPPGTGKTLMARATAGEIDAAFFTVKPSEIMSKWVGEAEQNIEKLFDTARSYDRAIIFIDEIDALVPKRRLSNSSVMQRVVPQILAELEGFDTSTDDTLLFMGATNEPWSLDPAIVRPGRFDERIYMGLPDELARRKILEINLKNKPLAPDVDIAQLAAQLEDYSGADIKNICVKAANNVFLEVIKDDTERPITMADLVTVIQKVKPSVSESDMKRFEEYNRKFA